MGKNIIIAFLIGLLIGNYAFAMKVPDIILTEVNSDLQELIQDYIVKIINESRYTMKVSGSAIASSDALEEGEFLLDTSGVSKYLVVSSGSVNYRVEVTAIP